MNWDVSYRADPRARKLADRHYSRQTHGAEQFVPPGSCIVLLTPGLDALWVTSWPKAEFVKHAWPGAWMCSLFRNESDLTSSALIRDAIAATRFYYGDPPPQGMLTFVDPSAVPGYFRRTPAGRVLEWGYSFREAGFVDADPPTTKAGLVALQLWPAAMPDPSPPSNTIFSSLVSA